MRRTVPVVPNGSTFGERVPIVSLLDVTGWMFVGRFRFSDTKSCALTHVPGVNIN